MTKTLMIKHLGTLRPDNEEGREALSKIGQGDRVMVEWRRPRNVQHHRLYFALIGIVWENMPDGRYPTRDDLHAAVKISAGLRTRIELPDGTLGFIPGSIAFHKMGQDEFDAFYDRVCDLIAAHFLPGVTSAELKAEVESMIGARAA